jgi:hypothetical protein
MIANWNVRTLNFGGYYILYVPVNITVSSFLRTRRDTERLYGTLPLSIASPPRSKGADLRIVYKSYS